MTTCRKQTVKEALAAARRSARRQLTPQERRIVKAQAKQNPVLICGRRKRRR